MSKKRGRPPKTAGAKKGPPAKRPKYLQETADSRGSTPSGSRCSSPGRGGGKAGRGRGVSTRGKPGGSVSRRGYNPQAAETRETEYHYGSDFGDESDEVKSDLEEEPFSTEDELSEDEKDQDSDFSLAESTHSGAKKGNGVVVRAPTPVLPWVQDEELPVLDLPASSEDLVIEPRLAIRVVAVGELLRRFKDAVRLSPFRVEELCAALHCEDHSALLAECHCALLRALLREADAQHTLFGPIDLKDSINVTLYSLDGITWPEVLRLFVESDRSFDPKTLKILNDNEYPFASAEDRLTVLEFLCDQFLMTAVVRGHLTGEVSISYDDHCRICHRFGDLLCCETCPAVFHLECVDPPLVDVPSDDWQCALCKIHRLEGTTDCISGMEKQGILCRHEHLGYDRHGRKYWFVARRLFVEAEDGTVWYYSTVMQFEELFKLLDPEVMEAPLYFKIEEIRNELLRQMELTENLTNQHKGPRKSYIEVNNEFIKSLRNEGNGTEPAEEDKMDSEMHSIEDADDALRDNVQSEVTVGADDDGDSEDNVDPENGADSKTDSGKSEIVKTEPKDKIPDNLRLARQKMEELSKGATLFKLGNEGSFHNYVNHYLSNNLALNKVQRNEERDKKRHLSNKFAIACDKEFKWSGLSNSTLTQLKAMLKQTLLHFENHIGLSFMHPNWNVVRKAWLLAVQACNIPRDFARVMVVFQACIKSVVFLPVWHEQLGHIHLQRITSAERDERKKLEKREKKEKEEEEERNKEALFVKYTIPAKHQIWKQKGEEYRVHAQWGWLWNSATRKYCTYPSRPYNLSKGPQKIVTQIKYEDEHKVLSLDVPSHEYLLTCIVKNEKEEQAKLTEGGIDVKALKIVETPETFQELDIEKALTSKNRIYYPKIAKHSKLNDLLRRREQLKMLEEKKFNENTSTKKEVKSEDDQNIDVEKVDDSEVKNTTVNSTASKESVIAMSKEIQLAKQRYAEIAKLAKGYKCYTKGCNAASAKLLQTVLNCYSPLCIRRVRLEKELILLLKKVHTSVNANSNPATKLSGKAVPEIPDVKISPLESLISSIKQAELFEEDVNLSIAKFEEPFKVEVKHEVNEETEIKPDVPMDEGAIPAIGNEMEVIQNSVPNSEVGSLDSDNSNDKTESSDSEKDKKLKDYIIHSETDANDEDRPPIPKLRISTRGRTTRSSTILPAKEAVKKTPVKPRVSTYVQKPNRRFCVGRPIKKEDTIKTETTPDGSVKIYSASNPAGKIYLKHVADYNNENKKKIPSPKYPVCSSFQSKVSKSKSIMILARHELQKLARHAGRWNIIGFNSNSKQNTYAWPYPCPRPSFKTCWLYRNVNLTSLSAVALQLKILWHCMRWDDMAQKPSNTDGKHQITTETEIVTLEILKQRHTGQFYDKTQYLRRKVVIPLEVPKTVREVASIRIGLRKRKRAESPQNMEPQVTEEWVDEDKLELWEIKQFGERAEKCTPVTRASTGKLPPARNLQEKEGTMITRASAQEFKEKMEQQLRQQRAAHQQKRALELSQVVNQDGNVKLVNKINATQVSGKSALTSLLTSNTSPNIGNKTVIGTKRVIMTKGGDGTAKIINQSNVVSKSPAQSLIKSKETPQKVQIIRTTDGKLTVRGLIPGQQLVQTPDGKFHIVVANQANNAVSGGQVIATGTTPSPSAAKIAVASPITPKLGIKPQLQNIASKGSLITVNPANNNKVIIRQAVKTDSPATTTSQKIITTSGQQIVLQSGQQIFMQPSQPVIVQSQQRIVQPTQLVQVSQGNVTPQNGRPVQTVVMQSPQIVQASTAVIQGQPVIRPVQVQAGQQSQIVNRIVSQGQQIVINNPTLAQQFTTGKIQLATINGQQVLIRPTGQNQAHIVAHLTPQVQNQIQVVNSNQSQPATPQNNSENTTEAAQVAVSPQSNQASPVKQGSPVQAAVPPQTNQAAVPPQTNQAAVPPLACLTPSNQPASLTEEQSLEQKLLAGQPPGTVIKTVTAQVVNLDSGPRIILQGLQGNSLTQQQLALVQQQVKQQLLKAQEVTGNQGVLGPTKLYLAVQPSQPANTILPVIAPSLTPIRQHNQISQDKIAEDILTNGQDDDEPKAHIIHKNIKKAPTPTKEPVDELTDDQEPNNDPDKFVITPDYIQQTIRNALKQENLNPEIEEKLLQLQRYQEKRMKPEVSSHSSSDRYPSPPPSYTGRRRPPSANPRYNDDDEWLETLPRRRNRNTYERFELEDTPPPPPTRPSRSRPSRSTQNIPPRTYSPIDISPISDERRRISHHSKLHVMLFKHKEMLKKDIIKKRGLLEKELGIEIQKELSAELALRTRAERTKQDEVRAVTSTNVNNTTPNQSSSTRHSNRSNRPSHPPLHRSSLNMKSTAPPKPSHSTPNSKPSSSSRNRSSKKEKLHCICQTPYDDSKFYVGCEHCNNWFHGDCVGITEQMSKKMEEYICSECKHAEDTQELYCLCRQPYDNSQFYICCDRCQDWFHGRCVGIIPSEADNIDEYVCPNCQKNSSVNFANMKELTQRDFDNLKKMVKQIQTHRSAWPFMEPVDAREAPTYYKVIKEPMDLQTIEKKINDQHYNMLSEFISDVTKMFDNCRYFNPKDSQFYKCAENLEAFFAQKVKYFREKLFVMNQ